MSPHLQPIRNEYSECLICQKPLGADSKSEGFMFCQEHRICSKCGESLDITEAKLCLRKFLEDIKSEESNSPIDYRDIDIIHGRCSILSRDPTHTIKQSELDYLNLVRLMVTPDVKLSQNLNEKNADIYSQRFIAGMNFEQKSLHMSMLQACLSRVQIAIRQDKDYRKGFLAEREKERFDNARKEALTSSRPSTKDAADVEEIQLAHFIELRKLNPANRKENIKQLQIRNKVVKNLIKKFPHLTETQAIEMCEGFKEFKTEELSE